jgi:general secretion pathway protein C
MSYATILEKNPFGPPLTFHPIAGGWSSSQISGGSTADLILVGTVVGPDRLSYAIFEEKPRRGQKKQKVVRYGEEVLNYGLLSEIKSASVTLKRDAETVTIPIVKMERRESRARPSQSSASTSIAKKVGEREYLLNREKVHQALDNPEKLLTDARLLPHLRNNKQEGFRMLEVSRGGIYDSLGLKNGDILLKVNELEISDPEVAIKAMTALKGMDRVNLDIIRRGEKLSLSYEIR